MRFITFLFDTQELQPGMLTSFPVEEFPSLGSVISWCNKYKQEYDIFPFGYCLCDIEEKKRYTTYFNAEIITSAVNKATTGVYKYVHTINDQYIPYDTETDSVMYINI